MANNKIIRKVIIDTDPGIDDAMALMMALQAHDRGEIFVEAICLVEGNCSVKDATKNMSAVMSFYPHLSKIPVYIGASEGLVKKFEFPDNPFHGVNGFNGVLHDFGIDLNLQKESAALGLIEHTKNHPGEIDLVCLGPLTNVALAMKIDENFAPRIRKFFVMGGNAEGIGNVTITGEFNFWADPEAAYIFLQKVQSPVVTVTWELCWLYVKISLDWRKHVFGAIDDPRIRFLNTIEYPWYDDLMYRKDWVACDQIVMAVYLDESIVTSRQNYWATMELQGEITRGQMVIEKRSFLETSKKHNVDIIKSIETEKMKQLFMSAFEGKKAK